jgi:hypothetical protein
MTVDVSLSTDGHVAFRDVKEILEGAGCGPVRIVRVQEMPEVDIPRIGHFEFRDPANRRRTREMRVHHFLHPDSETDSHITGEEYSYCVMGAHGGGPKAMQSLADAFGGKYRNDDVGTEELVQGRRSAGPTA